MAVVGMHGGSWGGGDGGGGVEVEGEGRKWRWKGRHQHGSAYIGGPDRRFGDGKMNDDASMSSMGLRGWGAFYEPPARNLGLQLMSSVPADRDTKHLLSATPFLHHHQHQQHVPHHHHQPHHPRDCGTNANANGNGNGVGYGMMLATHTLRMLQHQPEPQPQLQHPPSPPHPKEECISPPLMEENVPVKPPPPKKRQQGKQPKVPRPKKPKKPAAPREDGAPPSAPAPRRRGPRKNIGMVINGIDLDLSRIPTRICSCTGAPQQCYRWGAGGWQSACCTTTVSTYPLPMSMKRRGARIAGRKMSHGAFKKVLEKLASEGYNLNNPIDLKTFWAKHGTNKESGAI
uniref:GAGA-binding transcriptional activator n=1 Tax=Oryza glumipatula TaxID=40148 RepID=A0A0E0B770_9ORYZ